MGIIQSGEVHANCSSQLGGEASQLRKQLVEDRAMYTRVAELEQHLTSATGANKELERQLGASRRAQQLCAEGSATLGAEVAELRGLIAERESSHDIQLKKQCAEEAPQQLAAIQRLELCLAEARGAHKASAQTCEQLNTQVDVLRSQLAKEEQSSGHLRTQAAEFQ